MSAGEIEVKEEAQPTKKYYGSLEAVFTYAATTLLAGASAGIAVYKNDSLTAATSGVVAGFFLATTIRNYCAYRNG